jgi:hypothetical protein
MLEWIQNHETLLWWLAASSVIAFVSTLVAVPILLVRIPFDYYARGKDHAKPSIEFHPMVPAILVIGKNALGCVLVVVGIVLLVLPGQGVLSILVGIALLDFPGKHRLERWIVSRGPVLRSINWLRRRSGRPPLVYGE